jgi:hypothetical protein
MSIVFQPTVQRRNRLRPASFNDYKRLETIVGVSLTFISSVEVEKKVAPLLYPYPFRTLVHRPNNKQIRLSWQRYEGKITISTVGYIAFNG